jgi:hypothetical protein
MAKKITVTLTPAEIKTAQGIARTKAESQKLFEEVAALRTRACVLDEDAYTLENEADDAESALVTDIENRLHAAASAEAKRLNKANTNPKIEYVAGYGPMATVTLARGKHIRVETSVVRKEKTYDRTAELVKEMKSLGYTVTKAK